MLGFADLAAERAQGEKKYLKSEMKHFGVPVPGVRKAAVEFCKQSPDLIREDLLKLAGDLWASEWYEQENLPADAIRHALAADDFERAADLAELVWPDWSGSYQSLTWLSWLKELPDNLVRTRPVLSLSYAWALLNAGNLEAAESRLKDVERWMGPETVSSQKIIVDEKQFRTLPVSLATARAYHSQAVGNSEDTIKYTRWVLDLLPDEDSQWRAEATVVLGMAYWASGDLEAAYQTIAAGISGMKSLYS